MQRHLFLLLPALTILGISGISTPGRAQSQHKIEGIVTDHHTRTPLAGAIVQVVAPAINKTKITTNKKGQFSIAFDGKQATIYVSLTGYKTDTLLIPFNQTTLNIRLKPVPATVNDIRIKNVKQRMVMDQAPMPVANEVMVAEQGAPSPKIMIRGMATQGIYGSRAPIGYPDHQTEDYSPVNENVFHAVTDQPLSTFSIDVDRASYSNIRRFLNNGDMPPADAVRVEEMINYFDYKYANPTGNAPVAIHTDMAVCPWNTDHQLVRIAIKGKDVAKDNLPASNLVFLIDVSGSMSGPQRLPLVKQAFKALTAQLRPVDKVAIVVYAGAAGLVLPSTSGENKTAILDALDKLEAGGSTAGGEGILLAYKTAAENLLQNGNNRVIIATDGDFNVGPSSDGELQRIIEREREKGIFLSVLGFGMGNYKDNKLEILADKGNGNYAYIDNFEEARRTFVTEFGGTLFTIAKDVKLQIEFNPKYVQSYRLVGYENRMLQNEDFNNDKKDAGDMGAGHTVTALYEIVPSGKGNDQPLAVDPLKYQLAKQPVGNSQEVLTVKLRYKEPKASTSQLITQVLPWKSQDITSAPEDFRMATAVADFGLLLRNSEYKGNATWDQVLKLAGNARGTDEEGYRAEFIQLVKKAQLISNNHGTK
ncbi:YfbK domain-containing protein [Chitinophaga filiformis]|uniref:von Willebrand factor type A domain-containing protein n=1 Tax=Chitinophaga filiformis TaxID=104663 RepID=A0ABY4I429_CHIFI|nr:von Willebrand factor type A domain-containing protein [Chitinophaga filiformis]UPK70852.1 von Willebrand factor type A domain-containing protein [Chitinophaga filiformis]